MKTSVRQYYEDLKNAIERIAVTEAGKGILSVERGVEKAIRLIKSQAARGGKLYFIGNGASASIASHQAVDFWKGTGIPAFAFNDAALLTCISNDFGYDRVFEKPLELFLNSKDILIAISSSGQSRNILRAVKTAKKKNSIVITLSGFRPANTLRERGNLNFYVPVAAYGLVEVVHHSILHCILDTLIKHRRNQ
jgi:D-sedoheptulose 7-phosphate isomerase